MSSILLALNRCLLMTRANLGDQLFNGKKTLIWIFFMPFLYGFTAFMIEKPIIFTPYLMMWSRNPHFGYFDDVDNHYSIPLYLANNIMACTCIPLIYILFGIAHLLMHKKGLKSDSSIKSQKAIFIQVFIICLVFMMLAAFYVVLQYFEAPIFIHYFTQLLWVLHCGLPSVVYLSLNQTIRRKLRLQTVIYPKIQTSAMFAIQVNVSKAKLVK
uniref:Uncharacterized protein n=1 Tax=Panagrolaimus sp. JU765 TaxID=591449 RepID=A0AC34QY05_9BILA